MWHGYFSQQSKDAGWPTFFWLNDYDHEVEISYVTNGLSYEHSWADTEYRGRLKKFSRIGQASQAPELITAGQVVDLIRRGKR